MPKNSTRQQFNDIDNESSSHTQKEFSQYFVEVPDGFNKFNETSQIQLIERNNSQHDGLDLNDERQERNKKDQQLVIN